MRTRKKKAADVAHGAGAIRFGTSGWRGVLGDEVDFPRLRLLVSATAQWLREHSPERRVWVGFDTRFASERMAVIAAEGLRAAGLEPALSNGPVPTPAVTHALRRRRAAGGLVLTASHNPPEYHGLKVFDANGCGLADAAARRIERVIAGRKSAPEVAHSGRRLRRVDLLASYRRDLLGLLDVPLIRRARLRVDYDAMHGAGSGVLDAILGAAGVRVTVLRGGRDPLFGGESPDPTPSRLAGLARRMRARGAAHLGLATDGDADRFGAVLRGGRVLSETEVIALLVDHLARTGRARRGLAISTCTGSLAEKVALQHGLPVVRTPVGFKHLAERLLSGEVDVAGEESGGFALARMGRDKDGLLAGALLCEIAAGGRGGVRSRLDALESRFGRSACGRRAVTASPALDRALERLAASPPARVGDAAVRDVDQGDGLRLVLDDGFVMWRRSGTEPVIRVYAEASGPRRLTARLRQAEALLGEARP